MRTRGALMVTAVALLSIGGLALAWQRWGPSAIVNPTGRGAANFTRNFAPEHGLGPLFNATACVACHNEPTIGGMGKGTVGTALRVGRLNDGSFDPLDGQGGPVARARSVAELGLACTLQAGIPPGANVTSVRNAPPLFGLGLIDDIPDESILAEAERQKSAGRVNGRAHQVIDADGKLRIGRFGWKAQIARLDDMVGDAFRTELGITNLRAPMDLSPPSADRACGGAAETEDDGTLVRSVTAFITSLDSPIGSAEQTQSAGAAIFRDIGCAECHTPSLRGAVGPVPLYSDLLLHDVGPTLDDAVIQGQARGRDWRTTPLWGLRLRARFLHDARAENLPAAITAHAGEASPQIAAYRALTEEQREALLAFLREL